MPFSSFPLGHFSLSFPLIHARVRMASPSRAWESSKGPQMRGARFMVRHVQRQRPRTVLPFAKLCLLAWGLPLSSWEKIDVFVFLKMLVMPVGKNQPPAPKSRQPLLKASWQSWGISTGSLGPAAPDKRWPVLMYRLPLHLSRAFLF